MGALYDRTSRNAEVSFLWSNWLILWDVYGWDLIEGVWKLMRMSLFTRVLLQNVLLNNSHFRHWLLLVFKRDVTEYSDIEPERYWISIHVKIPYTFPNLYFILIVISPEPFLIQLRLTPTTKPQFWQEIILSPRKIVEFFLWKIAYSNYERLQVLLFWKIAYSFNWMVRTLSHLKITCIRHHVTWHPSMSFWAISRYLPYHFIIWNRFIAIQFIWF